MAIYFPDGNGGRKVVDGFGGSNFSLAELKLTGFSEVASANGEITDEDNLLVALAKCWNRKAMPMTTVRTPSQHGTLTYNGTKQSPVWNGFDEEQLRIVTGNEATNAGSYKTTFALKTGCQWEDETMTNKDVEWKIGRAAIEKVPSQSNTLFYDGTPKAPSWRNYSSVQLTIGGTTSATEVGSYVATFTPKDGAAWSDGKSDTKSVTWKLERATVAVPTVTNTSFTYDAKTHVPTISSYDTNLITVTGNGAQTNFGNYKVVFALKNSTNYR